MEFGTRLATYGMFVLGVLPLPLAAQDAMTTYAARGNEPSWSVEFSTDTLMVTRLGSKGVDSYPVPVPVIDSATGAKQFVVPGGPTVVISPVTCRDSMTGMPYPESVTLIDEEGTSTGCGGDPAALLKGAEWTVTAIRGKPVPDGVSATIAFLDEGRVAGSSGCNRYTGTYTLDAEGLTLSPLAMTRMACPEPGMTTERAFARAMARTDRFDIAPDGTLVLIGRDKPVLSARR